ncbi:MAG: RDD family protein, partial [Chloroflexota bacterium]
MNDHLSIDTPENIILNAEIAGFGTRCIGAIIDYLILLVFILFASNLYWQSIPLVNRTQGAALAVLSLIQFVIITFYHLILELFWNGQTIGKRIVGTRVVQANGLPLTASGAVIRNLVRLFDFLPIFYGIGLITIFASKQTQRLGDLAARTIVIREQRQVTLQTIKENYNVAYHFISVTSPLPYYIQIEPLSPDDRRMVVDFLHRRYEIRDRDQIAQLLAR